MKFKVRSNEAEIMDNLEFEAGYIMNQTLRELRTINKWLGGNHVTLDALEEAISEAPVSEEATLKVADLGCGGGDILIMLAQWFRKKGRKARLIGIDANPNIIRYATSNSKDFAEISYKEMNIFSEEFKKEKFDIINCTLFCHHFTCLQLQQLFGALRQQATTAIIINDLHRHWFAYYSIAILTRLFSRSYMVQHDAKLSVLRAFIRNELEEIIKAAGYQKYSIRWKWAFRYQVILYP